MEKDKITRSILDSTIQLINEFSEIDDDILNVKPSENIWSAGNIAEHLIILEGTLNKILEGNVKATERDPVKSVDLIKSYLLDFDKKLNAPEPIAPKKVVIEKNFILNEFKNNRNNLLGIIESNDITLICSDFNHRLFGELTRVEWVYFILYHTERHLHQLKNLKNMLNAG